MSERWSLGVWIGIPVTGFLVLIVLLVLVVGILLRVKGKTKEEKRAIDRYTMSPDDRRAGFWIIVGSVISLFLIAVVFVVLFWPFQTEYHKWMPHSGTVALIDERILTQDKSVEQKFVVQFTGSDAQYGCTDTRCANVEKGDHLTLSCKRVWQYTGTHGYDCTFVSKESQ